MNYQAPTRQAASQPISSLSLPQPGWAVGAIIAHWNQQAWEGREAAQNAYKRRAGAIQARHEAARTLEKLLRPLGVDCYATGNRASSGTGDGRIVFRLHHREVAAGTILMGSDAYVCAYTLIDGGYAQSYPLTDTAGLGAFLLGHSVYCWREGLGCELPDPCHDISI